LATSCREISTLSSAMAFHIKLGWLIIGKAALHPMSSSNG
jgi:hypothetical protein